MKGGSCEDMPTVFLIRHGESQSNAGLPTLSSEIVELTDKGWKQAKAIAQFLQEAQLIPDLIVTSSYLRTKQTAAPATLTFSSIPEEQWSVHEFTYLSMWHEENSTTEDRRQMVEYYWELSDPSIVDDPKFGSPAPESFEQFIMRVRRVRAQLEQTELDVIVIFSHEQFITAFRWLSEPDTLPITSETMRKFRAFLKTNPVPNGAIVRVEFRDSYKRWRYELITSHLERPETVAVGP